MCRVLAAIRDPHDSATLLHGAEAARVRDGELAVVLVVDDPTGASHLAHQRALTALLRGLIGSEAERVAIFVVSGNPGDDIDACAATWEAEVVVRWDSPYA